MMAITVTITIEDIREYFPGKSDDELSGYLNQHQKHITEWVLEAVWDYLEQEEEF